MNQVLTNVSMPGVSVGQPRSGAAQSEAKPRLSPRLPPQPSAQMDPPPNDLPRATTDVADADGGQMNQVLTNVSMPGVSVDQPRSGVAQSEAKPLLLRSSQGTLLRCLVRIFLKLEFAFLAS